MSPSKRQGENGRPWDGDGVLPSETFRENVEVWEEGVSIPRVLPFSKTPPGDIVQGLLSHEEPQRSLL